MKETTSSVQMSEPEKKAWSKPDVECITKNYILSGTTPHSYEDVFPFDTFQHS